MGSVAKDSNWPVMINLSNGVIGVSILAMPFCMKECGILLGISIVVAMNMLTRFSSYCLIHGAFLVRRRSYEQFALQAHGISAKATVEIMTILYNIFNLVAFFIVIGDLGPDIVSMWFKIPSEYYEHVRVAVMALIALGVVLPLSLLRNADSLSSFSSMAILFYAGFVIRMLIAALSQMWDGDWMDKISWWRPAGFLQCLPIIALSLSCQTQIFAISDSLPELTPANMDLVIAGAMNLCSIVYGSVGLFGYIAFYDKPMTGDILVLFDSSSLLTQLIKIMFLLSVAVSFPLMIFPCRSAIYTMLFKQYSSQSLDLVIDIVPEQPFRIITISLIAINLLIGIMIPNIEFLLGLTGSLIGSVICFVIPAALYLRVTKPQDETYFNARLAAKACVGIGLFILIACTYATLMPTEHQPSSIQVAQQHLHEVEMQKGEATGDLKNAKIPEFEKFQDLKPKENEDSGEKLNGRSPKGFAVEEKKRIAIESGEVKEKRESEFRGKNQADKVANLNATKEKMKKVEKIGTPPSSSSLNEKEKAVRFNDDKSVKSNGDDTLK